MSERLDAAVRELEQVYRGLEEIVRVDVDESGTFVLTAHGPLGTRWFTSDDRGLIERFPERDTALPIAARLVGTDDWRVLSYRPGKRMVVVVQRDELVNVLKGHKRSRSARAAVHQGVAEGAMRRGAFRVPRLLRHDGEHEALVFEYLRASEVELDAESAGLYGRLGAELAVFQRDAGAQDLKFFGVQDEFAVLELWQRKVLQVMGELPAGWAAACAVLTRRATELPEAEYGLVHRDLHDRQVHRVEGGLALLDFDLLCRADVALDPGNLVAHLRWRALQGLHGADTDSVELLEQAFLDGLGRARERGFQARFNFYTASTFLRLALVYRLRPRWSTLAPQLVEHARTALEDLAPTR